MARARLLKPGFFKNEELAKLSAYHRLCFAGLWTLADREGRLEDRPERIKAELFPYDETLSVGSVAGMLRDLAMSRLIVRFGVKGGARKVDRFIAIPTFRDHQTPHHREPASHIPEPPQRHRPSTLPIGAPSVPIGAPELPIAAEVLPIGADRSPIASRSLADRESLTLEESTVSSDQKPEASPSDPVTGDPVTGDPVTGDPVTGDPVTGDPVTGDPVLRRTERAAAPTPTREAFEHFYGKFHEWYHAKPALDRTKDGARMKRLLLEADGLLVVQARINAFFDRRADPFFANCRHTFDVFFSASTQTKLIAFLSGPADLSDTARYNLAATDEAERLILEHDARRTAHGPHR